MRPTSLLLHGALAAPTAAGFSSLAGLVVLALALGGGCATGNIPDSSVDPGAGGGGNAATGDDAGNPQVGNTDPYGGSGDDAGSSSPSSPSSPTPKPSGGDAGSSTPPPSNPNPPPSNPPPSSAPRAGAGDIVVSEIMYNPSGSEPNAEWFEIQNVASSAVSLDGLTLHDGSGNSHTISGGSSPIVVNPGDYVVLARDKATATASGVPSSAVVYQYAMLTLANGSTGGLSITDGSTSIASVPYGQWTAAANGESIELKTTSAPTTASSWCFAPNAMSGGSDKGSPGAPSDCP